MATKLAEYWSHGHFIASTSSKQHFIFKVYNFNLYAYKFKKQKLKVGSAKCYNYASGLPLIKHIKMNFKFLIRFYFLGLFTLMSFTGNSQVLLIEDLLKIYESDTNSVNHICDEMNYKQYKHIWRLEEQFYGFRSIVDPKYFFEISFPIDSFCIGKHLSYLFENKESFKKIRKSIIDIGFTKTSINQHKNPDYLIDKRFIKGKLQIEVIKRRGEIPYLICIQKVCNF